MARMGMIDLIKTRQKNICNRTTVILWSDGLGQKTEEVESSNKSIKAALKKRREKYFQMKMPVILQDMTLHSLSGSVHSC